eukprot:3938952-Rhodomonas_salina.1
MADGIREMVLHRDRVPEGKGEVVLFDSRNTYAQATARLEKMKAGLKLEMLCSLGPAASDTTQR